MQTNVSELVMQARSGDGNAFLKLFYMTFGNSYYFALRITGNENDAARIMAESYRKAFSSIASLQNPGSFEAWLKHITAVNCIDFLRRNNQLGHIGVTPSFSVRIEDGDEFLPAGIERSANVVDAINAITDTFTSAQKMVAMLYYFNGMPAVHIAKMLSCSEENIRNELYSVREKTKNNIECMISRETTVYPVAGTPLLSVILKNAGNQQSADETLMRNVFMSATNGAAEPAAQTAVIPKPAKEKKNNPAGVKKTVTAIVCGILVIALIVAGVIVLPKFIKKNGSDDDEPSQKINAEMLRNIELREEEYENILTEFSRALREDDEISDGGFNFVYLNDNDIPDLALNYKQESGFSEGVYEDIALVYVDGTDDDLFEIDSNKAMFGEKGYYIVADVEKYGGVISEGYFKYKYTDSETKEFCGGLKYDRYSDGEQGYRESWTYTENGNSEIKELSSMEEFERMKKEMLSGFSSALNSYDIEEYIESGEKLVKYLKKAETVYFGSEDVFAPTSENLSFSTALSDETGLSSTSTTEIAAGEVLAATESDWKAFVNDMEAHLTYNGKYNYISDDAYEIVLSEYGAPIIHGHYFETEPKSGFKDDPLGYFDYEYLVFDADEIDWIITNIYNQTPDHSLKNKGQYYYNGKYYAAFSPSGPPVSYLDIAGKTRQADGSYIITLKEFSHDIGYSEEDEIIDGTLSTYIIKAALKNVDGKRYWSLYSIENKSWVETTTRNPDFRGTTTSASPEWKLKYQKILEESGNINKSFILMDLDRNGIPELFLIDTSAQTDFCEVFMNGNDDEEESLWLSFAKMYMNKDGDFGFYNVYHSGGELRESYIKETFDGSGFVTEGAAVHFKGYEDSDNKTGTVEYWEYLEGDSETGERIEKDEYDAYVKEFEKEYREVEAHFIHDYLESGKGLETCIEAY